MRSNDLTRRVFQGCFPCDRLPHPDALRYPCALVVNMDPHGRSGSHWIAVFAASRRREVIYFDSLGLPTHPIIEQSFLTHFPQMKRNARAYQSPTTKTCAHFCIYFIHSLAQGHTFDQFLHRLNASGSPDLFVKYYVNKMFAVWKGEVNE